MTRATLRIGWKSIPGQRHRAEARENEDAVLVATDHPLLDAVLLVADGMGGHARPQLAAQTAARSAQEFLGQPHRLTASGSLSEALRAAVEHANHAVLDLGRAEGNGRAPATTLTLAVVADGAVHLANVGDGSVFLHRGGTMRRLAGGEDRRLGSRPDAYLGAGAALAPEECRVHLAAGDRLLLCTDGLTRYFGGEPGARRIAEILGRPEADVQAIASQLTAHSRGDDYDDDTSVVVVEVTELREVAPRPGARGGSRRASSRWPAAVVGALVGAGLLAAGFALGRGSRPQGPAVETAAPGGAVQPATAAELDRLPRGNLILVDDLGQRLYLLRTPAAAAAPGTVMLHALRFGSGGRLERVPGQFQLDTARRRLTLPGGESFPVATDAGSGAIQALRAGWLAVQAPGRAECWVDGRSAGPAPLKLKVAAGPHTVRVAGWLPERSIDVPAGGTVTFGPGAE